MNTYNWREKLSEIEALNEEYKKYGMTMTPNETHKLSEKRSQVIKLNANVIASGAYEELMSKVKKLQTARDIYKSYKKKEIDSWSSEKLSAQYGVTSVLLDMVTVGVNNMTGDIASERVKKLIKEAQDSGDKYKLRALADLLDGVIVKMSDTEDALKVEQVKNEAKRQVQELRETPDIVKSRDGVLTAFEDFSKTVREYKRIGEMIDSRTGFEINLMKFNIQNDADGLPEVQASND